MKNMCPKCGGKLIKERTPSGFLYKKCDNFPLCNYTTNYDLSSESTLQDADEEVTDAVKVTVEELLKKV